MREVKLGDIAKIITGKLDANAADEGGLYPFFTCSRDILRINNYAYDCECVLVAGNGDLNVKYYKGKFNAYQRTYIIEINEGVEYTTIFIYWFLQLYIETLRKNSVGSTIKYIKIGDLINIKLPLVSLSEQERIVALLDAEFEKIDAIKANAASQLQAAKDFFQAALKEMLTPQEGWERKTLEEISTDMYRGSGITRDQITEDGISCVRYGEIYTTYNYWFDNCKSHTIESKVKSPKYFEKGDILFTITGESVEDIAKSVAYLGSEKCLAGGDIVVMKHNQNAKYLSYALSTPDAIKQKGLGKTKLKVVHSNVPSIKSIVIPIPSLPEQERIAASLDAISEKVKALQSNYDKTITLCNDLKQALLKSIFE